ncbi:response regulator transcription factor [Novilysobacter avium]|uniref:Response regulator transcription factor n=1 Tax=Novilysobacter avium TaxID=2781023 RepID=A0A7S6UM85_9GAMM|nr:response regulator [Lysobacter avium]QOW22855.1 response regulator transcription factor [Lysobacter avium]
MTDVAAIATLVHLVDDNDAFRESIAWLLQTAGFEVREYASGPQFLAEVVDAAVTASSTSSAPAECLVSDIRMPEMSGLQLQAELRRRDNALPLVFVTAHGDVPLAVEAMRNGAAHFLEKPFSDDALIEAIRTALAKPVGAAVALAKLTPREKQVLDLVVASKPNKIIADILGISIKTVELHRANMMAKLGVRSVPDLMKVALGHG